MAKGPVVRGRSKDAPGRGAPVRKVFPKKKPSPMKKKAVATFSHGIKLKGAAPSKAPVAAKRGAASAAGPETPYAGYPRPTARDVVQIHAALAKLFGERRPAGKRAKKREILDTVVGTILSQNTTNVNSHRAFERLKERFSRWEEVRIAKLADVADPIKCAGLAPKKSKWIQHILQTIYKERGVTSMEYLRKCSKDEVHEQLERFPGIGKKTSAIINLFDCDHPDMAVDTHVFRYALQLGWLPTDAERAAHNQKAAHKDKWPTVTRDSVYAHLDATFPDSLKYSMHLILTDTEGGLPVVCPAGKVLSFDGKNVKVDGVTLKKQ